MDWLNCIKTKFTKKVNMDRNLINALTNSSSKRLKTQFLLELNEDTATSKISLTYDSLRELLEAVAISKGYKIYNHECYYSFLKEILNESIFADKFNNFRKIRNDINYYGKDVNIKEAKIIIKEMIDLIEKIRNRFLNQPF